ncbi:MAG: hypothetical protein GY820_21675 [Gammaproteobacteria bacterium]|nr:hypothetical protein [Gammaproteobacteria bacterium]
MKDKYETDKSQFELDSADCGRKIQFASLDIIIIIAYFPFCLKHCIFKRCMKLDFSI